MKALSFIAGLLLASGSSIVAAEQVYRCGPEGRVYQSKPCPQGTVVEVADPRSAEQQRAARAAAKIDTRLADDLERDRRAREGLPLVKASGFNGRPPPEEPASAVPAKAKKKPNAAPAKS